MAAVYFLCVIIITTDDEGKYKLPLSDSMTEARERKERKKDNKPGYMATLDAFRWAGAMLETGYDKVREHGSNAPRQRAVL